MTHLQKVTLTPSHLKALKMLNLFLVTSNLKMFGFKENLLALVQLGLNQNEKVVTAEALALKKRTVQ